MPIDPPILDDIRQAATVEELRRRIVVYAPEWTDHNDSDPGIALIQLFGYLAEQIGYRLNRVPEKNHIELLKLLGVRLLPAHAAATRLALLLDTPSTLVGYVLRAGARARAKKGNPPPSFETTADHDVVPAEATLLLTTKNPFLDDVLLLEDGTRETPVAWSAVVPAPDTEWLTVVWDGKTPKRKDLPTDPVVLRKREAHRYLWLGLDFNAALEAGFRSARVTLTVQLDDDEKPDLTRDELCETPRPAGEAAPIVDWVAYWNGAEIRPVAGRIDDTTRHLERSGTIRFTVPLDVGAISTWKDLRPASTVGPLEACLELGEVMKVQLAPLPPLGTLTAGDYKTVLSTALVAAKDKAAAVAPAIVHPLDPTLRGPVRGWIRVALRAAAAGTPSPKIRMVTFNAVDAVNATTVRNEVVGKGDGRPGQRLGLVNRNVLTGTLSLAMQEAIDPATPLVEWKEVDSLDGAGPFDSVFTLDAEGGTITFGDGIRGRIPPLVPRTGQIVALKYQHGGGLAGEIAAGAIESLETPAAGVGGAVNFVAARGGRDSETLEEAKRRARKELSTRSRAVTAADFEWIAKNTEEVRVARAHVIALRRPLPPGSAAPVPPAPRCPPALPRGPNGLDTGVAAGAVTVVVVPDLVPPVAEPIPEPSFLRAVCRHLDRHRLVTTELHIVPPQYCRVCRVLVQVRAKPGYTRARLQDLVEKRLGTYLHVLTGGEDGKGFPFGGQLHVADLIAQVFRVEGVERVDTLSADFTRTKSNASPRQGQLVLCPTLPDQMDRVELGPEENVSIDVTSIAVSTVS